MSTTRTPTELAAAAGQGDPRAADELFEALYSELRTLAQRVLGRQNCDTLQPTALVHEAYLKLIRPEGAGPAGTAHFRALAARAMKQILIDHARAAGRQKRGGGGSWRKVSLDDVFYRGADQCEPTQVDLLTIHETLAKMKSLDERLAQVVELRLLGGLTVTEVAQVLEMSVRSVERDWAMGRAWLRRDLASEEGEQLS